MLRKRQDQTSKTKAKRGPSLHWMFVPYQKSCIIEVEHTTSTSFQPLLATATPPRRAYVCRRRNQCIVWVYFFKSSSSVNIMHKWSMGLVKGSLILQMGHSRGAVHDTGHARIMQQASLVSCNMKKGKPFSFAQDSGDDKSDSYLSFLLLH